jgi:hypothetical protein
LGSSTGSTEAQAVALSTPLCPACASYLAAERWAIDHQDSLTPSAKPHEPGACTCAATELMLDVLALSPHQLAQKPQRGTPRRLAWDTLAAQLGLPFRGTEKGGHGGWAGGRYQGAVRQKARLLSTGLLVLDIDDGGDVDRVASALARYAAVIHETFSSTAEAPRCRAVLRLAEPVDAATYDKLHAVVRAHLAAVGVTADPGAKDACRMSYWPVRRPGALYSWALCAGQPLDVRAVLAAQPPAPPPRPAPPPPSHRDSYVRGALRAAAAAVRGAGPGLRHSTLLREAFGLARLGLDEATISAALLEPAVATMGERRRREAERAIRDAVVARRTHRG